VFLSCVGIYYYWNLIYCRNPGYKTVESELLDALVQADVVRPDHIEQPGAKVCPEFLHFYLWNTLILSPYCIATFWAGLIWKTDSKVFDTHQTAHKAVLKINFVHICQTAVRLLVAEKCQKRQSSKRTWMTWTLLIWPLPMTTVKGSYCLFYSV